MARVVIKRGRERSILNHHPWIFSGAIERVVGEPGIGETVEVQDGHGNFLCLAAYSPHSQIRGRVWTWREGEQVNQDFFLKRIRSAKEFRDELIKPEATNAYRLVHAESDGLPGLIVDRYSNWLVVQYLSAGVECWRKEIEEALIEVTGIANLYERSDVDVRRLEGLAERSGIVNGEWGGWVDIVENKRVFRVDIARGQKTGFFLDQRENRNILTRFVAGKSVLNCFSYTGGFSVFALSGGASEVTSIDSSAEAIKGEETNLALNGFTSDATERICGDVFQQLRAFRDRTRKFDVIILDPPKFAANSAQVQKAARAYKDINLLAFKLLKPGGTLFSFSCSGGISADLFQKIVAGAAKDANVDGVIIGEMTQAGDHPVSLSFPEAAYLKGLICKIR